MMQQRELSPTSNQISTIVDEPPQQSSGIVALSSLYESAVVQDRVNFSTVTNSAICEYNMSSSSCQFGAVETMNDDSPIAPYIRMSLQQPVCIGCGYEIRERYLLKVVDDYWHESCLVCFGCGMQLSDKQTSCFVKDGHVYCRDDHRALFAVKCARCSLPLLANDYVYRCMRLTYHVRCFACVYCGQQLKKGDQYLIVEGQIICRQDYELLLCSSTSNNNTNSMSIHTGDLSESNRKTPKRPRTILNSQQRRAFKASFDKSPKPCRKVREALAKETGLSVRVVQVWFQNQRAKIKKIQRKQEIQKLNNNNNGGGGGSGSSSSSSAGRSAIDKSNGSDAKSSAGVGDDTKSMVDSLKSDDDDDSDNDVDDDDDEEDDDDDTLIFDQQQHHHRTNDDENATTAEPMGAGNPLDKLYNMHATYFSYT